jgi:DNA gyrase inhibitor GyrI
MRNMIIGSVILVLLAGLLFVGCQTSRSAYESAPYRVVRADGKFELRDYPALTVAETPMAQRGSRADGSFMRLFGFISGDNEVKEKIAMTTPVFMSGNGSNATMAFVLPVKMNLSDVPKPTDGAVRVRELPAGRFAVLRFSGGRNAGNEAEALTRLRDWLAQEKLSGTASPVYGYFDPPWTPGFMRRNEVMLQITD